MGAVKQEMIRQVDVDPSPYRWDYPFPPHDPYDVDRLVEAARAVLQNSSDVTGEPRKLPWHVCVELRSALAAFPERPR
ncbi:MAG: hypothetical protein P4L84_11320 [Isosphaeraceae bacterium]|nr:hypothetical protein [Isosphaeraceae bacterium]